MLWSSVCRHISVLIEIRKVTGTVCTDLHVLQHACRFKSWNVSPIEKYITHSREETFDAQSSFSASVGVFTVTQLLLCIVILTRKPVDFMCSNFTLVVLLCWELCVFSVRFLAGTQVLVSSSNHPTELQVLFLSHFGVAAEFFCICLVAKRRYFSTSWSRK